MISDSGRYWATGISVRYHEHPGGWTAEVEYFDDGFANDNPATGRIATQGKLNTRYVVRDGDSGSALAAVIDTMLADAKRLGIEFRDETGGPYLYYPGDGEWKDVHYPDGWQAMLAAESARLGWNSIYTLPEVAW